MARAKKRMAVIDAREGDSVRRLRQVADYLPTNYEASLAMDGSIIIKGHDDHGFTLDGYVIPRLASGLIAAREVK